MRLDRPEFLTTLRDVAATAATSLDTLAQVQRARTTSAPFTASATSTSASDPSATEPSEYGCALCKRSVESIVVGTTRLCDDCLHAAAHEATLHRQRTLVRRMAESVNHRLGEIAVLAVSAIDGDGLRTLPILDALLDQLRLEFSDRSGAFADAPNVVLAS